MSRSISYSDYTSDNNRHIYSMKNGHIIETIISKETGKILLQVVLK